MDQPLIAKEGSAYLVFEGLFNVCQAFRDNKIDGFTNVELLRKAAVISFDKCADILLGTLIGFKHFYPILYDFNRVNHISYFVDGLFAADFLLDKIIEFLFLGVRHEIPSFASSFVIIINRIYIRILHVPAKCGKHHPHIYPRNCNSSNELISEITNFQQ